MVKVIEFLLAFLLSLSLILMFFSSFSNLLNKVSYIFSFAHSTHTLTNLSLFGGLSWLYSSSVSFNYQTNSTTFIVLFNKVKYGRFELDSVAEFYSGGFIAKVPYVPT
ncbi:MAG: hypothetical protein N3D10_00185 [Candidatus Micrarchaeota archaeon]|nr:hypothetical protein [Candidatus Micrarchaeota archaeon]